MLRAAYAVAGMPYAHPDSCTASADAQLAHGGKIHGWLTATVG